MKKDSPELFEVLKANKEQKPVEQPGAEKTESAEAPAAQPAVPPPVPPQATLPALVQAVPAPQPEAPPPPAPPQAPAVPGSISMTIQSLITAIILICFAVIVSFSLGITYGRHMASQEEYAVSDTEGGGPDETNAEQPRQTEVMAKMITLCFWANDARGQGLSNAKAFYERLKNSGLPGTLRIQQNEANIYLTVEMQVKSTEEAVKIRDKYRTFQIDGKAYFKTCEIQ
ncbi:MAG: hypothetical protein HZA48_09345 [Planctomycetes bacterium]|nr:hypothetical protein [Planctomycetota bacterium]